MEDVYLYKKYLSLYMFIYERTLLRLSGLHFWHSRQVCVYLLLKKWISTRATESLGIGASEELEIIFVQKNMAQ